MFLICLVLLYNSCLLEAWQNKIIKRKVAEAQFENRKSKLRFYSAFAPLRLTLPQIKNTPPSSGLPLQPRNAYHHISLPFRLRGLQQLR